MTKAVVVCPGRGTYNKTELGYLQRHFPDSALLAEFAMPVCGGGLVAAVRALPMSAGAPVSAATADPKPRFDTTTVSGYRHITDVVVLTGETKSVFRPLVLQSSAQNSSPGG